MTPLHYVRECELCAAREDIETEEPEHRAWICRDCQYECHDWDDRED